LQVGLRFAAPPHVAVGEGRLVRATLVGGSLSELHIAGDPLIHDFSTVHFFLLNGDMELNKNRQIFVNKML